MGIAFPGESPEYRVARDRLLEREIELRRAMEAVAAARRELPPGGVVPRDYVFHGRGADGAPVEVRLSELFAPDKDSLLIYSFMFPRDPQDQTPGPSTGEPTLRSGLTSKAHSHCQRSLPLAGSYAAIPAVLAMTTSAPPFASVRTNGDE